MKTVALRKGDIKSNGELELNDLYGDFDFHEVIDVKFIGGIEASYFFCYFWDDDGRYLFKPLYRVEDCK